MSERKRSKAYALIEEFLTGKLPDELQMRIGYWISRLRDQDEGMDALQDIFDGLSEKYPNPNLRTVRQWRQICRKLGFIDRVSRRTLLVQKRLLRVAVVLLPLFIGLAGLVGSYWFNMRDEVLQPEMSLVAAAEGTRKVVELPCGTQVILSAGSVLTYDEKRYLTDRHVLLDGEAYFTVSPVEGSSFRVEAGELIVRVLGTQFNVKVSNEDSPAEISLFSGSVAVEASGQEYTLSPRQQLLCGAGLDVPTIREFDTESVGAWRTTLELDNIPLQEAFRMIGSHFGVRVDTEGFNPGNKSVRAILRNNTLAEVLFILQQTHDNFQYEISGDTVYITPK